MVEAGYDDIDFVHDITPDELKDIGITKPGMFTCTAHLHVHVHVHCNYDVLCHFEML